MAGQSEKKKKNTIEGTFVEDGRRITSNEDIRQEAFHYLSNLFKSSRPNLKVMEKMLDGIEPKISDAVFTKCDIEKALKQMHPTKAPRPDGPHALFFQHY